MALHLSLNGQTPMWAPKKKWTQQIYKKGKHIYLLILLPSAVY